MECITFIELIYRSCFPIIESDLTVSHYHDFGNITILSHRIHSVLVHSALGLVRKSSLPCLINVSNAVYYILSWQMLNVFQVCYVSHCLVQVQVPPPPLLYVQNITIKRHMPILDLFQNSYVVKGRLFDLIKLLIIIYFTHIVHIFRTNCVVCMYWWYYQTYEVFQIN